MSQQVISQDATLDDIIFKDKNREFGAFLLRTTYPKVIKRSVILGSSLFVGALLLAAFWKQITADNKDKTEIIAETMKIDQPPPQKKVELPPPPPPPGTHSRVVASAAPITQPGIYGVGIGVPFCTQARAVGLVAPNT